MDRADIYVKSDLYCLEMVNFTRQPITTDLSLQGLRVFWLCTDFMIKKFLTVYQLQLSRINFHRYSIARRTVAKNTNSLIHCSITQSGTFGSTHFSCFVAHHTIFTHTFLFRIIPALPIISTSSSPTISP